MPKPFLKDRTLFLLRLRSNPFFLMAHLLDLTCAVFGKISNVVRRKVNSKHFGSKRYLGWLEKNLCFKNINLGEGSGLILPDYPVVPPDSLSNHLTRTFVNESRDDPEANFERNRWGFLFETLLDDLADNEGVHARILDWIESHKDKNADVWEPYSACERVANLLTFFAASPTLPEKIVFEFVADSIEWTYQHLEYYGESGTNNHILNNARALVLGGVATDNKLAYQAGVDIFRKFLPMMIGERGFLRERSSHYQLVVTNWVLDAWRFVATSYGAEHAETKFFHDYGLLMINAAASLCDRNGRLLGRIGDISPDATPEFSSLRLARLYPEFWPVLGVSDEATLVEDGWFRAFAENQCVLGNFPSGFFPPKFPTHGHCDYTSFIWVVNGREVLTDSGRYRYTADEISSLQKSAFGHNLPLVDGFSPLCESLVENGLWWPKPYASAILKATVESGKVVLSHDGFARATNVKQHTRTISLESDQLEIVDFFDGLGRAEIQICWHFSEGFQQFDEACNSVTGVGGEIRFVTSGFADSSPDCPDYNHSNKGWISTAYGEVEPALIVDVCGSVVLPVTITTRFDSRKCAA